MRIPDNLQPPEGCVILGWRGEFILPTKQHPGWCKLSKSSQWSYSTTLSWDVPGYIYAAPIDSEIARLNSPEKTVGSETPRTDAEELRMQDSPSIPEDHIVHSNFARVLERELVAALDNIDAENRRWTDHANGLVEKLAAKDALIGELGQKAFHSLRLDQPWNGSDAVKKLIEASEILLHQKSYDGFGWELIDGALRAAKEMLPAMELLQVALASNERLSAGKEGQS